MINFVELTQYKMLRELYNNRYAKIIIVKTNSNERYSMIEIDKSISNEQLMNILNDQSEKRIFIRESDYNQICENSYSKTDDNSSMQ